MDDRTTTDFHRTLPLNVPGPAVKVAQKKRRPVLLVLLLAVAAGAGYWYYTRQAPQPPPGRADFVATTPVVAATAATGDIDITLNALGTVTSLATVTIRSNISGYLVNVAYTEGQIVKKGDLLAEIELASVRIGARQRAGSARA